MMNYLAETDNVDHEHGPKLRVVERHLQVTVLLVMQTAHKPIFLFCLVNVGVVSALCPYFVPSSFFAFSVSFISFFMHIHSSQCNTLSHLP